jgi:hypothetical protein
VLTDKEAFLLPGAEMVVGPWVDGLAPAPEGRYVLVVRRRIDLAAALVLPSGPPPAAGSGETSVSLWDARTRKASVIWRHPAADGAHIDGMEWLPQSDLALVVARVRLRLPGRDTDEERRSLLLVDASRASARPVATLGEMEGLTVSPTQPVAALTAVDFTTGRGRSTLRLVRANGTVGAPLELPENASVARWSPDGTELYLSAARFSDTEPKKLQTAWHGLDLRTNRLRQLDAAPPEPENDKPYAVAAFDARVAALPVRLKAGARATLAEGETKTSVQPLWLESVAKSEQPRALIAADTSDAAFLLPDASAVLYVREDALYAVPILRVDKAAYLAARREAQKLTAISNARQIGTAIMMYTQDYDENFPPAGDDAAEKIMPYI